MDKIAQALNMKPIEIEYHEFQCDPTIARLEALARNAEMATCDKCGVSGNRPNMIRWHFENCKTVIKTCKQCGSDIPRQGTKDYLYSKKIYCNRQCYMQSKKGVYPIRKLHDGK